MRTATETAEHDATEIADSPKSTCAFNAPAKKKDNSKSTKIGLEPQQYLNDFRKAATVLLSKLVISRPKTESADSSEKPNLRPNFSSPWIGRAIKAGLAIYVATSVAHIQDLQNSVEQLRQSLQETNEQLGRVSAESSTSAVSQSDGDKQGRPLDRTETPPTLPPTAEQTLRQLADKLTARIDELRETSPDLAATVELQYRQLQHASQTALYFFKIEEPEKAVKFSKEWCTQELARLSPIYKRAMAEADYEQSKQLEQIGRSAFFNATAADCAKDARLRMGGWYRARGSGVVFDDLYPLPDLTAADSIAQASNDIFYYSIGDKVFKVEGEDASQYQIWCPGRGTAKLFYDVSGQRLMVLRDKLYVLDMNVGAWSVIDGVLFPDAPMTTASDGDIIALGRADNGRVQFLHRYSTSGKLDQTSQLSEQLVLPCAEKELLFTTDGSDLILQHADAKTGAHWVAIIQDDGKVQYQGAEQLGRKIQIHKRQSQDG